MNCNDNKNEQRLNPITFEPTLRSILPEMDDDSAICRGHEPLWQKVEIRGTDIYRECAVSSEMLLIGIDAAIVGDNRIKYKLPNGETECEMYFISPDQMNNSYERSESLL